MIKEVIHYPLHEHQLMADNRLLLTANNRRSKNDTAVKEIMG